MIQCFLHSIDASGEITANFANNMKHINTRTVCRQNASFSMPAEGIHSKHFILAE
jgi:hypothetical protein